MEAIAADLRMSPRTLQRRLGDAGTSVSGVLDDLRSELATSLAREGRTVAEMTYLLGYAETRAFVRAFRRWTGTTPRGLRESAGAA
ncbi:MAG: helix-turn-helix domain-containing protein [Polyangiaceae bacterium]